MKTQQTDKSLNSLTAAIMREGVRDGWIEDERTSPPQAPKQGDTCPATAGPTSTGAHSPLPIATSKVDKWMDELRKTLVDRSEFKLADHVVSARVIIKAKDDELERVLDSRDKLLRLREQDARDYVQAKAHAQRLAEALKKAQTFIAKLEKMDVLPVNSDSGLDWDTRFIIREALAQWEGDKQ